MKYEVTVICCLCAKEIRSYRVAQPPPGNVKVEVHKECDEVAVSEVEFLYAQDAIHNRTLEMN